MARHYPLNPKQAAFCREYVIDQNGSQAAKRAGYAKSCSKATASRLLTNPNVKAEIQRLQREAQKRCEWQLDEAVRVYRNFIEFDIRDLVELDGNGNVKMKPFDEWPDGAHSVVNEISQTAHGIRLKLVEKKGAADSLKALLGLDAPKRSEIDVATGVAIHVHREDGAEVDPMTGLLIANEQDQP